MFRKNDPSLRIELNGTLEFSVVPIPSSVALWYLCDGSQEEVWYVIVVTFLHRNHLQPLYYLVSLVESFVSVSNRG